jgi:hypothetical protein
MAHLAVKQHLGVSSVMAHLAVKQHLGVSSGMAHLAVKQHLGVSSVVEAQPYGRRLRHRGVSLLDVATYNMGGALYVSSNPKKAQKSLHL